MPLAAGKRVMMSFSSKAQLSVDDNTLVGAAQSGDENSLSVLLFKYEPFIKSYCSTLTCSGIDFEDLIQEGRIGLVSAVKLFRCDAGASFKTYACLCIKRQIVSAIRTAVSGKNSPMNAYVSFDDVSKDEAICEKSVSPEETVINREYLDAVKTALSGMFSEQERKIFLMHLNGYTYKVIAETVNTEVKQVDNSLQRIKRKLSVIFS